MIRLLSYYVYRILSISLILMMPQVDILYRLLLVALFFLLQSFIKSRYIYSRQRIILLISFNIFISVIVFYYSIHLFMLGLILLVSTLSFFEKLLIDKSLISRLKRIQDHVELSAFSLTIDSIAYSNKQLFPLQDKEYRYLRDFVLYRYPKGIYSIIQTETDISFEVFQMKVV